MSGNFEVDNSVNAPSLKDKLTVTEFFEDRLDYGSKVIEITGKVFEISYVTLEGEGERRGGGGYVAYMILKFHMLQGAHLSGPVTYKF